MKYITSFMTLAFFALSLTANAGVKPVKDKKAKSEQGCSKSCSQKCGPDCHPESGCCSKSK